MWLIGGLLDHTPQGIGAAAGLIANFTIIIVFIYFQ